MWVSSSMLVEWQRRAQIIKSKMISGVTRALSGPSFNEIDIICAMRRTTSARKKCDWVYVRERFIETDSQQIVSIHYVQSEREAKRTNEIESSLFLIHKSKISSWMGATSVCVDNAILYSHEGVSFRICFHHFSIKWNITLMCSWFVCTLF